MVNTIEPPIDPTFPPSHLTKMEDPGAYTIDCMIEGSTLYKTFYDTGSRVNIMSTLKYKHQGCLKVTRLWEHHNIQSIAGSFVCQHVVLHHLQKAL
jgi:hypothetical protein